MCLMETWSAECASSGSDITWYENQSCQFFRGPEWEAWGGLVSWGEFSEGVG